MGLLPKSVRYNTCRHYCWLSEAPDHSGVPGGQSRSRFISSRVFFLYNYIQHETFVYSIFYEFYCYTFE